MWNERRQINMKQNNNENMLHFSIDAARAIDERRLKWNKTFFINDFDKNLLNAGMEPSKEDGLFWEYVSQKWLVFVVGVRTELVVFVSFWHFVSQRMSYELWGGIYMDFCLGIFNSKRWQLRLCERVSYYITGWIAEISRRHVRDLAVDIIAIVAEMRFLIFVLLEIVVSDRTKGVIKYDGVKISNVPFNIFSITVSNSI